jgi:hypothetical protein
MGNPGQESRSRGWERWKANTAAALAATPMFDMMIFMAWSGAMFGLGFAAGWLARRRLSRRMGRRSWSLR